MNLAERIFLCVAVLCVCTAARGGDYSAGTFHSPKGFGVALDYDTRGPILNSYVLYADIYGIPGDKFNTPGYKFVWTHYNLLGEKSTDESQISFWLGPGLSAGYVHDHEKDGRAGICATVNCSGAVRFEFSRNIVVDLGISIELGMFASRKDNYSEITVYSNGIRQGLYPQLKLMYTFK